MWLQTLHQEFSIFPTGNLITLKAVSAATKTREDVARVTKKHKSFIIVNWVTCLSKNFNEVMQFQFERRDKWVRELQEKAVSTRNSKLLKKLILPIQPCQQW